MDELRAELTRILESSDWWDGRVNSIQVTEAGERSIELRALVSARNASDAWNLRCLVREGLISYLKANHPDCLPRTRAELTEPAPSASSGDGIANRKLKA